MSDKILRKKLIITASCDRDVAEAAKRKARHLKISFSALVERALAWYLDKLFELKRHGAETPPRKEG